MTRRAVHAALAALLAVLACAGGGMSARAHAADPPVVDGRVIVRWKTVAGAPARSAARASVAGVTRATYPFIESELLEVAPGTAASVAARLSADPRVAWAEPDRVWSIARVPDDELFPRQWWLRNTGQTGGTPGADVNAPTAWDITTGDSTLLIGVIDTGADYDHPDLAGNVWTNPGEIPGNGLDDDGNGYVDDVHGYDVINNDGDPFDDNGHGTHVAGILAARGDDGVGITGLCWRARLVPIKFLGASGSGTTSGAIAAMGYALRVGVRLTNNSWGGGASSQALTDAVDALGAAGQLVVAAAGNSATDNDLIPTFPASIARPWVISVAATDARDELAFYSNFGRESVDLAAPGSDVLSLAPGGGYRVLSGTSMACPLVSGAAALIWSVTPTLGAAEVRERLLAAVDTLAALAGACRTGGRLDALLAVAEPDSTPPGAIADVRTTTSGSDYVTLAWTATGDDSSAGRASWYDVRVGTEPVTPEGFDAARAVPGPDPRSAGSLDTLEVGGLAPATTYWFALRARDERGNPGPVSNTVARATLGPPTLALAPDSLAVSLEVGGTATRALTVANTGEGTLDWSVPLPELAFATPTPAPEVVVAKGEDGPAGPPTISGRGGPDAFGYRWIDSDQTDGPVFAWIDPAAGGALVPLLGDDALSAPIALGFEFPFYGERVSSLRVCTNGFLSFGDAAALFSNQPLPSRAAPPALVAPFWEDLDPGSTYRIWTRAEPGRFTVTWLGVPRYATGGAYTFQAILEASGEIRFQYRALGIPSNSATVGLQDAAREAGLTVAFNAAYLHDSLAVRLVPVPQWLTAAPAGGRVTAGASAGVGVGLSASGLLAGTYRGAVRVLTNDAARPVREVPVRLDVRGAPDVVARPRALDFGVVLAGAVTRRAFTLANAGTDVLTVTALVPDDARVSAAGAPFTLAPGASRVIEVAFAPVTPGVLAATLTVASDDPDSPAYAVTLSGRADPAPDVRVAPDSLSAALATGETADAGMRITNLGAGSYTFTVDALAHEASAAAARAGAGTSGPVGALAAGGPDAFGYTWRDRDAPGGPAFVWEDVRATGAPLALDGDDAQAGPVAIGFDFPFYGRVHRTVRVCTNGWVSFTDAARVSPVNTPLPSGTPGAPENLLAVFWDDLVFGPVRRAWVHATPERCLIQYQDVPRFGAGEAERPNTFAIVLFPNGVIEYRYLAVRAALRSTATVGIQDSARTDGLQVAFDTAYLRDSLVVRFLPPVRWLSVTPAQGTVTGGDSLALAVRFDARGLVGGTYRGVVRLSGDDPARPVLDVPCALTVRGVPDLRVEPAALAFGVTYDGWPARRTLLVRNVGSDTLHVTGIASGDARVRAEPPKPAVPPGGAREVVVTFTPVGPGALATTLTLGSDDPDTPVLTAEVSGLAVEPPRAAATPAAIASVAALGTLARAAERERVIEVRNLGAGTLHWNATVRAGPSILADHEPLTSERDKGASGTPGVLGDGGPDAFGYAWVDSDEPGGPPFEWADVSAIATPLPFTLDDQTFAGLPLPFAFPFYGRTFERVNVCSNGWLSFTSTRTTYTNGGLPDTGSASPENLIAVLWDDQSFEPSMGGGRVSWAAEPDRFVVTFEDVRRVGGGGPFTYQAVLHPSGDIDLQYLALGPRTTSATVGIQDSARTTGLQMVRDAGWLHDRLRVRIARTTPWLTLARAAGTVASGATDTLRVVLGAAGRDSARYRGEVVIASDDPARPLLAVPVTLEVALARADLAFPPAPWSLALGGDRVRVTVPAGALVRPRAGWIGDAHAAPVARADGGWEFTFDRLGALRSAAAGAGVPTIAIEDSARAWVTALDPPRLPLATLREPAPVRALGTGGEPVRVRTGETLALAWDDPPGAPATSWHVWLALDGGHAWRPWALGLAGRAAGLRLPDAECDSARLEITGMDGTRVVWSWVSEAFAIVAGPAALPEAFALRLAGANPARGPVGLEVALPGAADVALEVLDVTGARVRALGARRFEAGRHALVWDGLDDAGRRAPPGVYLVRVTAGRERGVRRVVLLR